MNLYLKQRFFSWGDRFTVYDENGNDRYYVEGEVFTFGKKLHVYDLAGNEVAFIQQRVFTFLPKYNITVGGRELGEVVKEFTFFHQVYTVEALGWEVHGDFFDHDYEIVGGGRQIASVSKQWFTLGDAYEISIDPNVDTVAALAVVLVIDACIDAQND